MTDHHKPDFIHFAKPSIGEEEIAEVGRCLRSGWVTTGPMGKPVVTTNGPGCRDTVAEGKTGFLVPPHDPRALESALRKLIESDDLRARFGAAARADARRRFSVETAVDRVASVYQDALSRP